MIKRIILGVIALLAIAFILEFVLYQDYGINTSLWLWHP